MYIKKEMQHHLPYTIWSVAIGLAIVGLLQFIAQVGGVNMSEPAHGLFHIFHALHALFSAAATTAMFWKHERDWLKAVLVGFTGTVGVCTISDVFLPYIAGTLLGVKMSLHICILQHPMLVLPFVFTGILLGLLAQSESHSLFSHSGHILVSSVASILYLISFGLNNWIHVLGLIFLYMIVAVVVPCCTSDIVFPLLLVKKERMRN